MGIANKYNTGEGAGSFNFDIPDTHDFVKLEDLYNENGSGEGYVIMMFFINTKGLYGDNPVIATPNELVNIPNHMLDTMKEMRNDPEVINAINRAELGFKIYTYENAYGVNYSIQFIDL